MPLFTTSQDCCLECGIPVVVPGPTGPNMSLDVHLDDMTLESIVGVNDVPIVLNQDVVLDDMTVESLVEVEIEPEVIDMPLQHAIYESGRDTIYGVREGMIHQFNSETGSLEASSRINYPDYGWSYLSYDPVSDKLYVSSFTEDLKRVQYSGLGDPYPQGGWASVDPDTLLSVDRFLYYLLSGTMRPFTGPTRHSFFQGDLVGCVLDGVNQELWRLDVANYLVQSDGNKFLALSESGAISGSNTEIWTSMAIDAVNGFAGFVSIEAGALYVYRLNDDDLTQYFNTTILSAVGNFGEARFTGVTFAQVGGQSRFYMVAMNNNVYKSIFVPPDPGTLMGGSLSEELPIDTGEADIRPINIAWNANNGLIYIPCPLTGKIVVFDPNTDTVSSVKTGFTQPIDMVFTPSKIWAVQQTGLPLKEVT